MRRAKDFDGHASRRGRPGAAVLVAGAVALLSAAPLAQSQELVDAPSAIIGSVDWDAADRDAQALGIEGARPEQSPTIVAATGGNANAAGLKLPLLLPSALLEAGRLGQLDEPLQLNADTFYYTAEAKAAPRSYFIQGTRFVFEDESIVFDPPPIGSEDVFVERLEYGIEASFARYGVSYSVTIFCADPLGDVECVEEDTVRFLVSQMTLVP